MASLVSFYQFSEKNILYLLIYNLFLCVCLVNKTWQINFTCQISLNQYLLSYSDFFFWRYYDSVPFRYKIHVNMTDLQDAEVV